jgi:hypothetical protein
MIPLIIQILLHQTTNAQECTTQGVAVKYKGLVMDNICIKRGTLMDNPSVRTLENPAVHTIHCLVDITSCVDSGYTLLAPPTTPDGKYTVKYQLGKVGTDLAYAEASRVRALGQLSAGFAMEFQGIDDGSGTLKCVVAMTTLTSDSVTQATLTTATLKTTSPGATSKNAGVISSLDFNICIVLLMFVFQ